MSAGWFPYLHLLFHYGFVNNCFQTVGETKHWRSVFWRRCTYSPERVGFYKDKINTFFKNSAQFHPSQREDTVVSKSKIWIVKWISSECTGADSVDNFPHRTRPITLAGTNWEQQHSPSEQHKGNWVTLGECEVWIWSSAPDPMGNCGFPERTKREIQKPGVGRKAEEMIRITPCCPVTEGVWAVLCWICSWRAATDTHSHCTDPQLFSPLFVSNMWWYEIFSSRWKYTFTSRTDVIRSSI